MGYRRRRGYGRRYSYYGISHRAELTSLFRGLDVAVQDLFLNLSGYQLERVLVEYKRRYGSNAASYARRAYPSWKNGTVQMSGMVRERLLNLVPPFLSERERLDLIRKLRASYLQPTEVRLEVRADSWEEQVIPAVNALVEKSRYDNLPARVVSRAQWLAAGNNQALREAIGRLEEEEGRIKVARLREEFAHIRLLLSNAERAKSVNHRIELPQGTIHIHIKPERRGVVSKAFAALSERKAMTEKGNGGLMRRPEQGGTLVPRSNNVLDAAFGHMTEEQIQQLRMKAMEEKLRIDVQEKDAEQRFVNSQRDVASTIKLANELNRTVNNDYDVRSQIETASGTTDIHIRRNKNMATLIAVIVLAVVVLLLLFR